MDNNSLSHTKWTCKYHIVFAPKYRRMVIVFICGTIAIFVIFGKKHKYKKFCAVVIFVTVMVMIIGILHEINLLNKEKTAYEFIKIENEEYVILSKVDDKVLVVPFEFDQGGKCHLLTSQY